MFQLLQQRFLQQFRIFKLESHLRYQGNIKSQILHITISFAVDLFVQTDCAIIMIRTGCVRFSNWNCYSHEVRDCKLKNLFLTACGSVSWIKSGNVIVSRIVSISWPSTGVPSVSWIIVASCCWENSWNNSCRSGDFRWSILAVFLSKCDQSHSEKNKDLE